MIEQRQKLTFLCSDSWFSQAQSHIIIMVKLSLYSMQGSTHKIPMNCDKFHVMYDDVMLCLQTEVNASVVATD